MFLIITIIVLCIVIIYLCIRLQAANERADKKEVKHEKHRTNEKH